MDRCKRSDCRYRAEEDGYDCYRCNYAEMTGRTRLGQIYRAYGLDKYDRKADFLAAPARCPFYERADMAATG